MISFFTFDSSALSGSSDYDPKSKSNPNPNHDHYENGDNYKHKNNYNYQQRTHRFGRTIDWLDNRHIDADELEKYRMVGDEEVDHLLNLIICSSSSSPSSPNKQEKEEEEEKESQGIGGTGASRKRRNRSTSSSSSSLSSLSASASFRFMDVIHCCAMLYNSNISQNHQDHHTNQHEHEHEHEHKHKHQRAGECVQEEVGEKQNFPSSILYNNNNENPNLHGNENERTIAEVECECENAMIQFYDHYHNPNNIPLWVDWDQLQRGIDVFIKYLPAIGEALFYLSLVPGFAIPKIAAVLQATKYLAPPSTTAQVKQRLLDTGGFLMSCMVPNINITADAHANANINNEHAKENEEKAIPAVGVRPGGAGWEMALRVRVLHAKVRRMILENGNGDNDGVKWNVNEYGIPINQEDMAATLLAFSVNGLSGIEFIAGRPISDDEQLDYIALWRYIGWLLGVYTDEEEAKQKRTRYHSISNKSSCDRDINDDDNDEDQKEKSAASLFLPPLDPCGPGVVGSNHNINNNNPLVHSHAMLESIVCHLMHPNELSCIISNHLLQMGNNKNNNNNNDNDINAQSKNRTQTQSTASSSYVSSKKNTSLSLKYLYRSYMCRQFVGNKLANELKLIQLSYSSLKHVVAYMLVTATLLLLRTYTLLTIHSSWFAHRAQKWHLKMISNVLIVWKKQNNKRMGAMSRMSFRTSLSTEPVEIRVKSMSVKSNNYESSCCPFSLVMPPIQSEKLNTDLNHDLHVKLKKTKNE